MAARCVFKVTNSQPQLSLFIGKGRNFIATTMS
jgi:hypothetical protein